MSPAVKISGQPGLHDRFGNSRPEDTGTKTEHVGIVVFTAQPGGILIVTERRPDTLLPVDGNRHANPGAADEDSPWTLPPGHLLGKRRCEIGIIY